MATGIASTAARGEAPRLSSALLVVAGTAFLLLSARAAVAAVRRPGAIAAELGSLPEVFDVLTLVAAAGVLSVRLHASGDDVAAAAAGAVAVAAWPVLTAAVAVTVIRRRLTTARAISGNWLLAVVATQSVATTAAVAALARDSPALARAAFAAWCAGLALYAVLIGPVTRRLVRLAARRGFTPDFWIAMGALAISTLAAAALLRAPGLPARSFVQATGIAIFLAALAWVPALAAIDLRATRSPGRPPASGRWAMVFPLAMLSAAAQADGHAAGWPALTTLGDWSTWVALVAWLAVATATARAVATGRWPTRRSPAP